MKKLLFYFVDDDPMILKLFSAALKDAGHNVKTTTSSVLALEEIPKVNPDCVLTDIMMPELDGLELCRKLRENPALSHIRIIVVSAKSYEFDKKRSDEFGADGYIVKTVDIDRLLSQIDEILSDKIEMAFWGVRGTLPVPGEKSVRYGGNTSCVSLSFKNGGLFVFDAGSGIKELSNHLMGAGAGRLEAKIFISHPHWDHINALPFFTPLFIPGNEFEILGAAQGDLSVREMISNQMDGVYFPVTIREFGSRVYFRDLRGETLEINGAAIETMLLSHPGYCLGYRVNYDGRSVCYITDNELFLPDSDSYNAQYVDMLAQFVGGADALITDTTYTDEEYKTKVGWGHSCISQVAQLAHVAEVKTLYLFHHDPDQDDNAIDRKLEMTCETLAELGSGTQCLAPAEGDKVFL